MPVEFLLTSLVVALVPGTGVIYTVSSSIGGTLGIVPRVLAATLGLFAILQAGA